jgi:hypothetical protein
MPDIKTIAHQSLRRFRRRLLNTPFLACIVLFIVYFTLTAQTSPSREYQLKAIFLYNFSQFVEWPATSFSSEEAPMIIGIIGSDPFGTYLEEAISGEKMNGHPLVIERYANIDEIGACQILFINLPDTKSRKQAITAVKDKGVLTVSDASDFLEHGGMIRFFTRQGKLKLQVHLEATKLAKLEVSSKLLRLVEIFTPKS